MTRPRVVQQHHIRYPHEPGGPLVVTLYKGEHHLLEQMKWWNRRSCSTGFLVALQHYVHDNWPRATHLQEVTR